MPPAPRDPEELVELLTRPSEVEAELVASALRDGGFKVQVLGGLLTGFRAEAPVRARVMVRRADLAAARAAWEAVRSDSVDIDWNEVDVGSPVREEPAAPGEFSRWSLTVALVMLFCALSVITVAWSAKLSAYAPAVAGLAIFFVCVGGLALYFGRADGPPR